MSKKLLYDLSLYTIPWRNIGQNMLACIVPQPPNADFLPLLTAIEATIVYCLDAVCALYPVTFCWRILLILLYHGKIIDPYFSMLPPLTYLC